MSSTIDIDAIAQELAAPFEAAEVKFKAQVISGNRALAVPYVDARVVQDRLDDVLGVMGWQDSYECLADGSVVCRLRVRVGDEWVTKEDVGSQSEQPDEGDRRKAAFSDAIKRAAVKFGIGRYLYRQKPQWVDYDPQKKQFVRMPTLPAAAQPVALAPLRGRPQNGSELQERLCNRDAALALAGRCKEGELVAHVVAAGLRAKLSADIGSWNDASSIDLAINEAKAFEQARSGVQQDRPITPDERAVLGAELDRVGRTWGGVVAALGLAKGTAMKDCTFGQLTAALAKLKVMPTKAG